MSVLPHPTGGYRAYKKVAGREYQFYSKNQIEAEKKQAEYDAFSRLKPKTAFSVCGRLKGYRLRLRQRMGRKPSIIVRNKKEFRYRGNFEEIWFLMLSEWKQVFSLMPQDVADYYQEIRKAKHLYIKDISKLELDFNEILLQ